MQADKNYKYAPLNANLSEIRLVRIQPGADDSLVRITLHHYSLTEAPPFHVLSYLWGDPRTQSTILCDGESFTVMDNLHSFLMAMRKRPSQPYIWIDEICINQANYEEKSRLLPILSNVHRTATFTLCWVGLEYTSTVRSFVAEMLPYICDHQSKISSCFSVTDILHSAYRATAEDLDLFEPLSHTITNSVWRRVDAFLASGYFKRYIS